jgi:type IV secretory pathway TraG/TraD family ATPase VirD4
VNGRALLDAAEVLTLSDDHLIAFLRGMAPVLARRIKWYQDPDFTPAAAATWAKALVWCVLLVAGTVLVWLELNGK